MQVECACGEYVEAGSACDMCGEIAEGDTRGGSVAPEFPDAGEPDTGAQNGRTEQSGSPVVAPGAPRGTYRSLQSVDFGRPEVPVNIPNASPVQEPEPDLSSYDELDSGLKSRLDAGLDAGLEPEREIYPDDSRRGSLGRYVLDLTDSLHIMDERGNTIYDIPFGEVDCRVYLWWLLVRRRGGKSIRLRTPEARQWARAIAHQKTKPVWYLCGSDDCEVRYGNTLLGVTPCMAEPPYSWKAFDAGRYELSVSRPGVGPVKVFAALGSGARRVTLSGGRPATRAPGEKPEGVSLSLNGERGLVMAGVPCLVDRNGTEILRMPDAEARVSLLKRGATITWRDERLGMLRYPIKCDSSLKYDRLQELLPVRKRVKPPKVSPEEPPEPAPEPAPEKPPEVPPEVPPEPVPPVQPPKKKSGFGSLFGFGKPGKPKGDKPESEPEGKPEGKPDKPKSKPKEKRGWFSRGSSKSKYNRGKYRNVEITITKNDLDTKLGRFDYTEFECICSNLFAAMGYKIEKGFDCRAGGNGRMLGEVVADRGIDVQASRGKERIVAQCKFYKGGGQIGGPDVNKTLGAAVQVGGTKVIMIGVAGYSKQCRDIQKDSKIPVELWDWTDLRSRLQKHLL